METNQMNHVMKSANAEQSCEKEQLANEAKPARIYSCTMCDRVYRCMSSLKSHELIHSGEKPHVCEECGKAFARHNGLVRHKMTHSGEKPFACEYCDKRFPQASYLKAHMRNHTGEKPYVCDICGECFKHSGYLQDHRRRNHTGEKRHQCRICHKLFSRASDRGRHERTHDPSNRGSYKRPHKCQNCGIRFKLEIGLDSHSCMGMRERAKPSKIVTLSPTKSGRKQFLPRKAIDTGAVYTSDDAMSDGPLPMGEPVSAFPFVNNEAEHSDTESVESILVPEMKIKQEPEVSTADDSQKFLVPEIEIKSEPEVPTADDSEKFLVSEIEIKSEVNKADDSEKLFGCETCFMRFYSSLELVEHSKSHRKPFRCVTCDLSFTWSLDLVRHTKTHNHKGERYRYEIYGKCYDDLDEPVTAQ